METRSAEFDREIYESNIQEAVKTLTGDPHNGCLIITSKGLSVTGDALHVLMGLANAMNESREFAFLLKEALRINKLRDKK